MNNVHTEYSDNARNWKKVRDLIKGESALKENDLSNVHSAILNASNAQFTRDTLYLPYTSENSVDSADLLRYYTYVERASLFNATRRTEKGMVGMVFNKPSIANLPTSLDYLNRDVDGTNVGILDLSVEVLEDILETGRCGLFVDYPITDAPLTISELQDSNFRATIIKYQAEQILDWDTINDGATQKLSFVKLLEIKTQRDPENIFNTLTTEVYRVLMLNEDGIYEQREYDCDDADHYTTFIPKDNLNQPFDFIPFFFIGATDNRPDVDVAPLLEIAEVNIKHYRNSADFEESTFLVGQPMVVYTGLTQTWIDDNFADGLRFGSRVVLPLPGDADVKLIQAEENNLAKIGMLQKENQMIMLGARLITDGSGNETAEAARIRHSADTSVMKVIVRNITNAFTKAIMAVQLFNGNVDEFEFQINEDFFATTISPQELSALVSAWMNGAIDLEKLTTKLDKSGI